MPFFRMGKPPVVPPQIIKAMKLLTLFLTVLLLQVSAHSTAQQVNYTVKDGKLKDAFDNLEKQTGMVFFYKSDLLNTAKTVTVDLKNLPIAKALDQLLKDQSLEYTIEGNTVFIKPKKVQPSAIANVIIENVNAAIDVHGVVKDESGKPVVGVSVLVKGSNKGTTTNEKGEFSISGVSENFLLIFSSVNMQTQEIKVRSDIAHGLVIVLKAKVNELDEVAVTSLNNGYQKISPERATGSFAQVRNELYNQQVGLSVLNRLEGIANGFTIDKKRANSFSTGMMIRGLSTIGGPKDPLIVLDNFPYDGDISNINPSDVESITLLKDAAAAAIWGTRAGNGVIVITTKKGHYNQPTTIDFSSNLTIAEKPNVWYRKPINSSDYIDVEQLLYSKGFYTSNISSVNKPALSPVIELLIKKSSGQISAADADAKINALRTVDVRNDFQKYIYNPAVQQQYALSLKGGNQNNSWFLSGGYDHNLSELSASLQRISLRSENTIRLGSALQLTGGLSYIQNNTVTGQNGYGSITSGGGVSLYPYAMLADENGNPIALNKSYRQSFLDTVGQGKLLDWKYYPLEDYKHAVTTSNRYDLMAFANLNYKISSDWTAELQYRYENQRIANQTLYDQGSFFTRNTINTFTQINYSNGQKTNKVPIGGILDQSNTLLEAFNYRAQIQYDRSWKKHRLSGLAGTEIREINTSINTYRTYGFNGDNLTTGSVDYTNTYPVLVTGFSSFIPNNTFLSKLSNHFVSTYGNLVYTYLDRYTISASGRRDASNIFGVNTNQKWTPLWSTGFSWQVSREKFYSIESLPYLKLSMSYGYSGNINPSQSALTTIANQSTSPYTLSPMATISQYGNPELRWEKAGQFNFRLEYKIPRNRITGTIEYFSKIGKDLYGLVPIDYTGAGTRTLVKNSASMKGYGWDIELNSLNVDRKFKWQTTLVWNIVKDKVTEYYTNSARAADYILSAGTYSLSPLAGYPVYSVFSYPFAGLDPLTGNPQGIFNKQLSTNYTALVGDSLQNAVYNGSAVPISQIALRNAFTIGRFSLSVNILGKFGYYFRRSTIDYSDLFNNGNGHADFAARWQNPGDEKYTTVPSMIYPLVANRDVFYRGSQPMVEKGDHIRLQYITLSYEYVPGKGANSPFKRIRVFVNASNLGILWRANTFKLDPDYLDNVIPPSTSFSVGCNLSF